MLDSFEAPRRGLFTFCRARAITNSGVSSRAPPIPLGSLCDNSESCRRSPLWSAARRFPRGQLAGRAHAGSTQADTTRASSLDESGGKPPHSKAPAPPSGVQPRSTLRCGEDSALSPLGERVACDGAFISRRGTGEGVQPPSTLRRGEDSALSPLRERVDCDGAFSRPSADGQVG
jgi:hypothetical protein